MKGLLVEPNGVVFKSVSLAHPRRRAGRASGLRNWRGADLGLSFEKVCGAGGSEAIAARGLKG